MTALNALDLRAHDAFGLVLFRSSDEVLCLFHKKFWFWTIPLGKVDPGMTLSGAVAAEARQELGIDVHEWRELVVRKTQVRHARRRVPIRMHIVEIQRFTGSIMNMEPNKHRELKFVSVDELRRLRPTSIATSLFVEQLLERCGL